MYLKIVIPEEETLQLKYLYNTLERFQLYWYVTTKTYKTLSNMRNNLYYFIQYTLERGFSPFTSYDKDLQMIQDFMNQFTMSMLIKVPKRCIGTPSQEDRDGITLSKFLIYATNLNETFTKRVHYTLEFLKNTLLQIPDNTHTYRKQLIGLNNNNIEHDKTKEYITKFYETTINWLED